jgi:hypothetical protein
MNDTPEQVALFKTQLTMLLNDMKVPMFDPTNNLCEGSICRILTENNILLYREKDTSRVLVRSKLLKPSKQIGRNKFPNLSKVSSASVLLGSAMIQIGA